MVKDDGMDQKKLLRMIKRVQKAAESLTDSAHKDAILGGLDAVFEEAQKPVSMAVVRNTTLLH